MLTREGCATDNYTIALLPMNDLTMARAVVDDVGPHPVDTHVGARVKARRLLLGMSQEELAKAVGLTFQQIQKYERGANRISASRLTEIAKAMKTPLDYFFSGTGSLASEIGTSTRSKANMRGVSDVKQASFDDTEMMTRKDVIELVRAYQRISSAALKKQLLEMAKTMASTSAKK